MYSGWNPYSSLSLVSHGPESFVFTCFGTNHQQFAGGVGEGTAWSEGELWSSDCYLDRLPSLVLVPVLPQLPELAGAVSYRVFGDSGVPVRVYLGFPCYRLSIQPCQLILVFLALTHLPSRFQTLLLWFMFSQKIPLLFFFWGFRKE